MSIIRAIISVALIILSGSWAYTLCFEVTMSGGWVPFLTFILVPCWTFVHGIQIGYELDDELEEGS